MEQQFNEIQSENESAEVQWQNVKYVLLHTLKKEVGREEKRARKPWITKEMLEKMEERRKCKNVNKEEYRRLNNALRRETDRAKEKYMEEMCKEIEELERKGRYDLMYEKTKEFGGRERKAVRSFGIEDSRGQLISGQAEMLKVWESYIGELYDKEHRPQHINIEREDVIDEDERGPSILTTEVEKAIKDMKRNKATGDDDVPADLLKEIGNKGLKVITKLINKIYETGKWPKDFLNVTMVAIEKKQQAKKCSDFRTISLISHVAKIVARIINRRLQQKIEEVMGEDQFGFRKGRGTRDAIGMMRILSERILAANEEVCVSFIDWQKAFDRVNWTKLMDMLKEIGIDWRDRRLISNLYMEQNVKIQINQCETNSVKIGRGVRQGCCLSPSLFNLYGEFLAKEALKGCGNFKIGGRLINTIKYADDLVVLAKNQKQLQLMMNKLVETGKKYGMEINTEKSKVMRISKREEPLKINVDNRELENVMHFKYLGSLLTKDASCTKEIRARIAMAKEAFNKKWSLLTSKLSLSLRKKLAKSYVCTVWSRNVDP